MAAKKTHVSDDPKDWLFKRNRNDKHTRDKCTSGWSKAKAELMPDQLPAAGNTKKGSARKGNVIEFHHVACISSCRDSTMPISLTAEDKAFIKLCLAVTDWNINDGHNTMGLPRKWAYVRDPDNLTGWGKLPCHQVDHDLYRAEVSAFVREYVWDKIAQKRKKKDCDDLKGENVANIWKKIAQKYKPFLRTRGREMGGTKSSIDYCLKGKKDAGREDTWHIPFSMSPEPDEIRKRNKPPAGKKLKRAGLLAV